MRKGNGMAQNEVRAREQKINALSIFFFSEINKIESKRLCMAMTPILFDSVRWINLNRSIDALHNSMELRCVLHNHIKNRKIN